MKAQIGQRWLYTDTNFTFILEITPSNRCKIVHSYRNIGGEKRFSINSDHDLCVFAGSSASDGYSEFKKDSHSWQYLPGQDKESA